MKRTALLLSIMLLAIATVAQPPARQRQKAAQDDKTKKTATQAPQLSERAALEFPTMAAMPEDVPWRRDVYKMLDLSTDRNAVLYYPEEPQGNKMNLFTYLFKLVLRKQIKAYEYTIDGNENFVEKNVMKPLDMLDRFNIYYEEGENGKFRVDDNDIPSSQVKMFYIKESTYYDQTNSQFRTQVTAICPVRRGIGEYGGEEPPTPLFWLKYSDISPFLSKVILQSSNYNNAAQISADDYFTTAQYDGKIYKTNNLQGKILYNTAQNDSDIIRAQNQIEKEIQTLQDHVWGKDTTKVKKPAVADTTVAAPAPREEVQAEPRAAAKRAKATESTSSRSQVKREKTTGSATPSKQQPRLSVRRQRH